MRKQFFRKFTALVLTACLLTGIVPTALAEEVNVPVDVATSSDLTLLGDNTATGENPATGEIPTTGKNTSLKQESGSGEKEPTDGSNSSKEDPTSEDTWQVTFSVPDNGSTLKVYTSKADYEEDTASSTSFASIPSGTTFWLRATNVPEGETLVGVKYGGTTTRLSDASFTFTATETTATSVTIAAVFTTITMPDTDTDNESGSEGGTIVEPDYSTCAFTFGNTSYTVDSGTKFFAFLTEHFTAPSFDVTISGYQLSRDGGSTYTVANANTVIEHGDIYKRFYYISGNCLYITQSCDASALPSSGYDSYDIFPDFEVTVTHNVNGSDKTYKLTANGNSIYSIICWADTTKPISTLYRKTSTGALEVVNLSAPVPLTKETYLAPKYLSDYHWVDTAVTDGTAAFVPAGVDYWQEGKTVTFTLTPTKDNNGNDYLLEYQQPFVYVLDENWSVLYTLTCTKNEAGQYTFTMPTSTSTSFDFVRIRATFTSPSVPHSINCSWGTDGSNFEGCAASNFSPSPSNENGYSSGTPITVTITPTDGYELDTLTMNGESVTMTKPDDGMYSGTFTMPGITAWVVATFKEQTTTPTHTITVEADHGTVNVPETAAEGSTVNFTVTPDNGYELDDDTLTVKTDNGNIVEWTKDDNSIYAFTMPASNVTINATFKKCYKVSLPTEADISPDIAVFYIPSGITTYFPGKPVEFRIYPDSIYKLVDGSLSASYTDGSGATQTVSVQKLDSNIATEECYSFIMPEGDVTVAAEFKKTSSIIATYNNAIVTFTSDVTSSGSTTTAFVGDTVTFSIAPLNDGNHYRLSSSTLWGADLTTNDDGTYSFTMPDSNVALQVTYLRLYDIDVQMEGGDADCAVELSNNTPVGTLEAYAIEEIGGKHYALNGTTVGVTVTPSAACELDTVTVTKADGSNVHFINDCFDMPESDVTVTVKFKAKSQGAYTITVADTANGTVTPDKTTANQGDTVTLTVSPAANYQLEKLTIKCPDGSTFNATKVEGSDNEYSFAMPVCNVTIIATFRSNGSTYTITITPPEHGTVTLIQDDPAQQEFPAMMGIQFKATPEDSTYELDLEASAVTRKDGGDSPLVYPLGEDIYGFSMPESDVTMTLVFKKVYYNIANNVKDEKGDDVSDETFSFYAEGGGNKYKDGNIIYVRHSPIYRLDDLTIKDAENKPVTVTPDPSDPCRYSFTMPASDVTINGTLKKLYDVYVNADYVTADATFAAAGDLVTLTVEAESGYKLDTLTVAKIDDDSTTVTTHPVEGKTNKYTFTMPGCPVKVSAEFVQTYPITVTYYDGDTKLTEAPDWCFISTTEAATNEAVLIVNQSDPGYQLKIEATQGRGVMVQKLPVTQNDFGYTFTVEGSGDISVTITRSKIPYTITNNAPEADKETNHGYLTVLNPADLTVLTKATVGDLIPITVTPADGYVLESLTVLKDGEEVAPFISLTLVEEGLYNFTMPASNVTVSASFKAKQESYTITNAVPEADRDTNHGYLTVSQRAAAGETVSFKPIANTDYKVEWVSMTRANDSIGITLTPDSNGEYSFIMPDSDVTISAVFSKPKQMLIYSVPNVSSHVISLTGYASTLGHGRYYVVIGETVTLTVDPDALRDQNLSVVLSVTTTSASGTETLTPTVQDGKYVYTFTMPNQPISLNPVLGHQLTIKTIGDGTVTPTYEAMNGTVVDGKLYIAPQTTVTLNPSSGYVVTSVKLVNDWRAENGQSGEVTSDEVKVNDDGTGSFPMPDGYSTVTVTLEKADPTYTITIPATVSLNDAQSMTITASDVQNLAVNNQQITVRATSTSGKEKSLSPGCGWMVRVNGDEHIAYTFTSQFSFTESGNQALPLTIADGETTGKPAGTYEDTLTFTVSLTSISAAE